MSTPVLERPVSARPGAAPSRPAPPAGDHTAAGALRFAAWAALVLYGCEHWVRQVTPTATGVALQMAATGVGTAVALMLTGRLPAGRGRAVLGVAVAVLGAVLSLAAAGIPVRFAGWHHWSELGSGVGEGIGALPNLNVPYRGLDPWVRWVVLSGAGLLAVLAAVLAAAPGAATGPRRRAGAVLALGALYGIPVVERNPASPFLSGAGFTVLLALFVGAERVVAIRGARPRAVAAAGAALALGLAALLAPRLDGGSPWVDYRGLADGLAQRNQAVFDWNHSYAPLTWSRNGKELLRIKARQPSYWKATVLRRFDGLRWVGEDPQAPDAIDTPLPSGHPSWYEDMAVTVRGLRSQQYLTAGFATGIKDVPHPARLGGSGTYLAPGRPLRPGDTYTASVYTPHPSPAQLREAGEVYPDYVMRDLAIELPERVGGPAPGHPFPNGARVTTILFPPFGNPGRPTTFIPGRNAYLGGEDLLARSAYKRTWALAQQLRAQAGSPFALVRAVRRRVQQNAFYSERPKQAKVPLDGFLFDTHEGYCQQFSGAMALLLRMAGVPARIATGFTPGTLDADRGEYVVRDTDAHSWVEAFFPDIGWVTFDPTPTVAPPAAQEAGDGGDTLANGQSSDLQSRADVAKPSRQDAAKDPSAGGSGGGGTGPVVVGVVVGLALAALAAAIAGAWWWRRPHERLSPVDELHRALARSGRPVTAGQTLQAVEQRFAGTPPAQAYVRKLRLARYAGAPDTPSRRERAALRDELAAGLGITGRLRAWWALPPQRPHRS